MKRKNKRKEDEEEDVERTKKKEEEEEVRRKKEEEERDDEMRGHEQQVIISPHCGKNTGDTETIQQLAAFYLGALPPALKNKHSYKLPEKQKLWLTSKLPGSKRPFF